MQWNHLLSEARYYGRSHIGVSASTTVFDDTTA